MASTNKTTHYELSQFLGTDKPAWLTDYNSDMSKIDNGINTAQSTATGADGKADTANTNIGNLENLTTSNKTSTVAAINEVDGHADNAQETANSASNTANAASLKVDGLANYLSLDNHTNITVTVSGSGSPFFHSQNMRSAYNDNGSFGKIYGRVDFGKTNVPADLTFNFSDTGLRPSTQITINSAILFTPYDGGGGGTTGVKSLDLVINTDGTASTIASLAGSEGGGQLNIVPFVIFAEDFGD